MSEQGLIDCFLSEKGKGAKRQRVRFSDVFLEPLSGQARCNPDLPIRELNFLLMGAFPEEMPEVLWKIC